MSASSGRRLFRTVLFTDIVGSTELAAELGDRRWRRTVAAHHAAIRAELKRHHGREVDTAGDGFFAVFESPTDAVRCAAAAVAAAHALGLRIRAAVHTGELEPAGGKYGGIAVHIGARLLALAGAQEVLVSGTVRELVAGSGHAFDDRGIHQLKGVPGEWHVHALALPRFEDGVPLVSVDDEQLRAFAARRQRLVVAALLILVGLLAAGLASVFLLLDQPPPPVRGPNSIALYDAGGSAPVRAFAVDRGPSAIAVGDGTYWTANIDAGTVSRIDARSGHATSLGQTGTRPTLVAIAGDRVGVADRYSSRLTLLDATAGTVILSLPLHASSLLFAESQLWLADDIQDRLVRLDPTSGAQLAEISLGRTAGAADVVLAADHLWVAAPRAGGLLRVDPSAGTTVDIQLGIADVRAVSAYADNVWLASPGLDRVARVDAASGRVAVNAEVCDTPVDIAATPSGAWVVCALDRQLWRLDLAGTVTLKITLDAVPSALATDGELALVALRAD